MDRITLVLRWLFVSAMCLVAGQVCAQYSPTIVTSFTVKPNKCITLHKGQLCYQKIHFKWTVKAARELCIVRVSDQRVITCWQEEHAESRVSHSVKKKDGYEYRFSGAQTEAFQLREKDSTVSLAQVEVQVASVYRKNKKSSSGWRLF